MLTSKLRNLWKHAMIVNIDVKSLEVVVAAWLSRDAILLRELKNQLDIHKLNQEAFKLPERLIAKTLVFRILYGGNEFSFVHDADFQGVSTSLNYWRKVIERFYDKYQGIYNWHADSIRGVKKTGKMTSPFGRSFIWQRGMEKDTEIKNYIVQGTGADIVAMARCSIYRRWRDANIRGCLVNTVHDSIVADVHSEDVHKTITLFNSVFVDLPSNISRIFGVQFDVDVRIEVGVGNDMYNLKEIKI